MGIRRAAGWGLGAAVASGLAVEYAPSTVVLGQWTPLRALPGDLCRWRGPSTAPAVALTFDDGPDPVGTPAVLDRLDELGLAATFFVLGAMAEREPDLVAELSRRGHEVAIHGYHHEHHLLRRPGWVRADLAAADRVMTQLGCAPAWYRPTYGQATAATLGCARRRGWRTVLWSAWGGEWKNDGVGAVVRRIARRLEPGAIVLLHDGDAFGPPGMWQLARDALEPVAAELARRGLRAVPLRELVNGIRNGSGPGTSNL